MSRNVFNLKDSVAALLSGIDIQNVDNLYAAFERAARVFVQKAKIPETLGTQNLTVYDGVTDYAVNTAIYGTQVIDIRPQGITRNQNDFVFKKFQDDFDRNKNWTWQGTQATFTYNAGTPILRMKTSWTKPKAVLDGMNSITGWVASGDASGLALDSAYYYQQPGTLRFNLATSGSQGLLTKTITSTDLTSYLGVGVAFLALEIPSANLTSITLKIGSGAGAYYTITTTAPTIGSFAASQWMLVPFDLSGATTFGSPDITKITYIQIALNYNGTVMNNVRCGELFISLPTTMQMFYMTAGFFSVGGVVSNSITADTDIIVLNDSAYTIYEYECALSVLQQVGGATADSMTARIDGILNSSYTRTGRIMTVGLYDSYRNENPSESLRTSGNYYDNSLGYSQDNVV